MTIIENTPNAATLINSMRSIGYDFESAISDIIDNSISAQAKNIDLYFPIGDTENIYLSFFDDGIGMNREEVIEAMRFGSVKNTERSETDLGRFGLGLKTASISQCKRITVISKKNGEISGFFWDIDLLDGNKGWDMYELTQTEMLEFPRMDKYLNLNSFTLVHWSKFDTLEKDLTIFSTVSDIFYRKIRDTEKHIALVFHRFIEEGLSIRLNMMKVMSYDPFLLDHPKTTIKPEQIINTKTKDGSNEKVTMQVCILPYFKDLTSEDYEKLIYADSIDNQGFYIYRNKRLMIHGTWFRIKPKAELSRNARIRVDIPNTLDDMWSIDIKKQKAVIPGSLLEQLKGEVSDAVSRSRQIHDYKGTVQLRDGSVWVKTIDRDNKVFYQINKESDIIKRIISKLDESNHGQIDKLLELIQFSLPYKDIYNSVSEKKDINPIVEEQKDGILQQAYDIFCEIKKTKNMKEEQIIDFISSIEPFLSANIKDKLTEIINGKH